MSKLQSARRLIKHYSVACSAAAILVVLIVLLWIGLTAIGGWADRRHDAIEAIAAAASLAFTGILTISTIALWAVTRTAANAAARSADVAERTLTDLEGPFLYPAIAEGELGDVFDKFKRYTHETSVVGPVQPDMHFNISNYGRSPALPKTLSAVLFFGEPDDQHKDTYAGFMTESLIPTGTASSPIHRRMVGSIAREDYAAIKAGTSRIYLRGSVLFSDIFGNEYEQTFCLAWQPSTASFVAWGSDRNKRRLLR